MHLCRIHNSSKWNTAVIWFGNCLKSIIKIQIWILNMHSESSLTKIEKRVNLFFLILEITSSPMWNHKIYNNYGVKVACPCQLNKYISDNSLFSQQNEKRLMHKIVHTNFWTKWYGITRHSSYGLFALARAINRCIWYLN